MRRALRRALIAGIGIPLLFSAGVLAGTSLSRDAAPRRLRSAVEASLSNALGTPVTVAGARLRLFPGATIEATDVRAWSGPGGAAFRAGTLEASLDPSVLLTGRFRFSRISVSDASLALVHEADGSWSPPLFTPGFEDPTIVLGRILSASLPAASIEARSGTVTIEIRPRAGGRPSRIALENVGLHLLAPALLESGRLRLTGTLEETTGAGAAFELVAAPAIAARASASLGVRGFALDHLRSLGRSLGLPADLAGLGSGVLEVTPLGAGGTKLDVDVRIDDFVASSRGGPAPLRAPLVGVSGSLAFSDDGIALSDGSVRAEGLGLAVAGALSRGATPEVSDRVSGTAKLTALDVAGLRSAGAWLGPEAREGLERALRGLDAGAFHDVVLEGEAPVDAFLAAASGDGPPIPSGVTLSASVSDLVLHPEGDAPVTAVRGAARLQGPDRLEVHGLEGRLGERTLPVLDLRIDGLSHLLGAPSAPVRDAADLPGRAALQEMLFPARPPGESAEPPFTAAAIEADWIELPLLFRPLHGVRARLEPTPDGVAVRVERASWGGVPIRGEGELRSATADRPERVRVALEAGPPGVVPPPVPGGEAHGRFVLERAAGPGLRVGTIRGGFDLAGARLTLFDLSGELAVGGRLGGELRLDLGRTGEVPLEVRVQLLDAAVADVLAAVSDDPVGSAGRMDVTARLRGTVAPGRPLAPALSGDVRVTARSGELAIELPLLLAIAKASTTFNPFGSANGIRFDEIDADLALAEGVLSTKRSITLDSPDVRLVISGTVDLRQKPHPLEAVVGCFFLRPLDQVIGAIPVVSRIVLGPDKSLFGTYFELTGTWESPRAGIVPTRALALGPATFLLEDVPAFVRRGVEAIQSVLPDLGPKPPAVASPAEPAAPEDQGS